MSRSCSRATRFCGPACLASALLAASALAVNPPSGASASTSAAPFDVGELTLDSPAQHGSADLLLATCNIAICHCAEPPSWGVLAPASTSLAPLVDPAAGASSYIVTASAISMAAANCRMLQSVSPSLPTTRESTLLVPGGRFHSETGWLSLAASQSAVLNPENDYGTLATMAPQRFEAIPTGHALAASGSSTSIGSWACLQPPAATPTSLGSSLAGGLAPAAQTMRLGAAATPSLEPLAVRAALGGVVRQSTTSR
jgi:hypothetical protein